MWRSVARGFLAVWHGIDAREGWARGVEAADGTAWRGGRPRAFTRPLSTAVQKPIVEAFSDALSTFTRPLSTVPFGAVLSTATAGRNQSARVSWHANVGHRYGFGASGCRSHEPYT